MKSLFLSFLLVFITNLSSAGEFSSFDVREHIQKEPIAFWVAGPPTVKVIEEVLSKIIAKLTKYQERQKIIIRITTLKSFT